MKKATVIILSLLVVFTLLFIVSRSREAPLVEKQQVAKSAPDTTGQAPQASIAPVTPPKPPPTIEEGRSATDKVTKMIAAFHTRMGENPVGTNAEITQSLMGGNPIHATFSPDPPSINAKGELIDPWGTPYFFHQISGDDMEIHSAGPDKIMGTADDIIEN